MWPVLLRVGDFSLYSLGFFLCLGFFLATYVVWKQARSAGLAEEKVFDTLFLSTFLALAAGRLGFVFSHWPSFSADYSRIFLFTKYPGLSFPILLILAVAISGLMAKSYSLAVLWIWDILALAVAFFAVFATFGCFLDGCFLPSPFLPLGITGLALIFVLVNLIVARKFSKVADLADVAKKHGFFFLCYLIFQLLSLLMTTWFTANWSREAIYATALVLVTAILVVRYKDLFAYVHSSISQRRSHAN